MSQGYFTVLKVTDLKHLNEGDKFPESDYSTLTADNKFVQLKYIDGIEEAEPYKIGPGIYTIMASTGGLFLEKTSFTKDDILADFVNTAEIENKAACFFRNIHRYKELGIDVAKRNMLLYGPAGTGKTTALSKICNKYVDEGKTAVVIFPTEKLEAYQVKDFIKSFQYIDVDRLILIMEDLGGVEMAEVRRSSDSGLLSLLDNQEKTLKIPTLIIATTNFPETFMGNLTNRPGRFDDKIEAKYPAKEARIKLLQFFLKRELSEQEKSMMNSDKTNEFSPAHIKEVVIRSIIHEKSVEASIKEIISEIAHYKKSFTEGGSVGFKR